MNTLRVIVNWLFLLTLPITLPILLPILICFIIKDVITEDDLMVVRAFKTGDKWVWQ